MKNEDINYNKLITEWHKFNEYNNNFKFQIQSGCGKTTFISLYEDDCEDFIFSCKMKDISRRESERFIYKNIKIKIKNGTMITINGYMGCFYKINNEIDSKIILLFEH
jgi:hypothetical protein